MLALLVILDENDYHVVAGVKGLEPSTYRVTGDRSNQLSYTPIPFGIELVLPVNLLSPNHLPSLINIMIL